MVCQVSNDELWGRFVICHGRLKTCPTFHVTRQTKPDKALVETILLVHSVSVSATTFSSSGWSVLFVPNLFCEQLDCIGQPSTTPAVRPFRAIAEHVWNSQFVHPSFDGQVLIAEIAVAEMDQTPIITDLVCLSFE